MASFIKFSLPYESRNTGRSINDMIRILNLVNIAIQPLIKTKRKE